MDIFSIFTLFGGLAFFLYGMKIMSDGLEKSSDGKLNKNLNMITKNRFFALLFGAGMTVAVQSSSAVTVMLVGLVNSGILEFGQTICVLMGSNVGTTLTAWILSLAGIDSDVIWINLLKPANFAPLLALIGIILVMAAKKEKAKSAGGVLLGFSILMMGMTMMSDAMEPLSEMPEFAKMLTAFKNPLVAVIVGALFTGIIQSSAASIGILQTISLSGGLTYGMAIPIIMGQNIGTCVTAIISSIGVSRNAKKVAVVHLSFNIIGTMVCLIPFCIGDAIFNWAFADYEITPIMIAIVHSIFNIFTTAILLPFTNQLEKIANFVIKDKEETGVKEVLLDERILSVPTVAVERAFELSAEMCAVAEGAFLKAIKQIPEYSEKAAEEIAEAEGRLDRFEDELSTYMMKLSKIGVSDSDSKCVAKILHTVDDFERIGDLAMDFSNIVKDMHSKGQSFSEGADFEISTLSNAVMEILEITTKSFKETDIKLAKTVEPLDQAIGMLVLEAKRKHIVRLRNGICTKDTGFTFSDVLTIYERIAEHCSNIAVAVVESRHGSFDTHEYLQIMKEKPNNNFQKQYAAYMDKYSIS